MIIAASEEEITAARAYEELHVPALFRQWAPQVVEAAKIRQGHRVLDAACGTREHHPILVMMGTLLEH